MVTRILGMFADSSSLPLEAPSLLERYVSKATASLRLNQRILKGHEDEVKELLKLIARFEEPGHSVVQKEFGSESSESEERREIDVAEPAKKNGPTEGMFK